ncbi:uncharacterized protein A4U43_C01F2800 [Asparagus officinalis]|uniref:Protein cereblon n=1 Tax=Asparagus officinalis TaxID=4686 RepID=A0A5P1FL90_ASPOF|nr:uncharacterized protein A4U43_C01F2800 [Asparagus officinalis]
MLFIYSDISDSKFLFSFWLPSSGNDGGAGPYGGFTFNPCLASLHTYLGEVDDTHGRLSFLDGGAILNLPMFYLEGVVLFPEATLPLRVIQPRFKAAVERALQQVEASCTIGVVRVHRHPDDGRVRFATTGTTAEIRQYRQLDDGSLNVVARGRQRFRVRRRWIDVEGAPCAEVQIVQEDIPLKTPKDAFGLLASVGNSRKFSLSHAVPSGLSPNKRLTYEDAENSSECMSPASAESDHSDVCMRICPSASDSLSLYERIYESSSSDEESVYGRRKRLPKSFSTRSTRSTRSRASGKHCTKKLSKDDRLGWDSPESSAEKRSSDHEKWKGGCTVDGAKRVCRAPMSFWPHWVYQMYDSYALAQRAADLWRQIIGSPRLDDYTKKPDLLSFYIASKLPVSESERQELLEIDGISYRLQKEIQLLKSFNLICCKNCHTLIAKRSDMVIMSSDGPLNAYVNPHGYVHEAITVYNATALALWGSPSKEHSWFPGYAWTIANCATCESHMGWLFTATKKNLLPRSFWGIRSSQVADDTSNIEREASLA